MKLTPADFLFLYLCVEAFLFGLYSAIFGMHLQHYTRNEGTGSAKQPLVHYALCLLYVLSMAVLALDLSVFVVVGVTDDFSITVLRLIDSQYTAFACCDFIAQSILIYRCWIVWGRDIRVVIIPSILACTYLVTWIAQLGSLVKTPDGISGEALWATDLVLTALTASMIVNGLVTGLIVLKIFNVFRARSINITAEEKSLSVVRGVKLHSIIFVMTESAMALFAIQLARLIMVVVSTRRPDILENESYSSAYSFIVGIHEMLNGITPTIILVRVSMGLSFHDEASLDESVDSLRCAVQTRNTLPGIGSIGSLDGPGSLDIGPDSESVPPVTGDSISEARRDVRKSKEIRMVDT